MTPVRSVFCSLAAMLLAGPPLAVADAADLDIQLRGATGAPIRDAVVSVHLAGGATPPARLGADYSIDQQDLQFHPFVLVVPVGARVNFLNHDPTRHHVYSFSPAKRFELKLEQRQQDRSVLFDKAGIVPLGCNIHDKMIAFIDVVDTRWAMKAGPDGKASFRGLPAGPVTITIWHPYLKAPESRLERGVALAEGQPRHEDFVMALRNAPRPPAIADY